MSASKMSVPKRKLVAPAGAVGRETEPAYATGKLYWSLIKANVSLKALETCKDGKGLFTRGDQIRELVEKHHAMLSALSDVTFFPKKTTLQDAIEEANKDLENKLLPGAASDRIKLARAEAYAIKSMMLDIAQAAKSIVSGAKISPAVHALIKKFKLSKGEAAKPIWGVPSLPLVSPVRPMRKLDDAFVLDHDRSSIDACSTLAWSSPKSTSFASETLQASAPRVSEPSSSSSGESAAVQVSAASLQKSESALSLADRLFPLDLDDDMGDSQSSGVDIVEVVKNLKPSAADLAPAVPSKKRNFYELLGLKDPGETKKPGPNGFVIVVSSSGEHETDEPNIIFLNKDRIEAAAKAREAAAAAAKEEKKVQAKAKAQAKKAAKAKRAPAAKAQSAPAAQAKSEASPKARAPPPAALAAAVSPSAASAPDVPPYRRILVISAAKGTIRSYLTGLDTQNKRKLITELTAKHNPQHRALMEALKVRIESGKWTKDQAVAWRDSQIIRAS